MTLARLIEKDEVVISVPINGSITKTTIRLQDYTHNLFEASKFMKDKFNAVFEGTIKLTPRSPDNEATKLLEEASYINRDSLSFYIC